MPGLANVRVVLVRPKGAANVGAVARAMKNMGLGELVLVEPRLADTPLARALAVHADDVLGAARETASLAEAVADCALVVGTTAHAGPYRVRPQSPREAAAEIVARAASQHVALVFGPEDHGLSNDDLKGCQRLLTIPTAPEYPSLNLAQAVMVCAYELCVAAAGATEAEAATELASSERIALLLERLEQALSSLGFLAEQNPDHIMHALRSILGRAGLDEREVRILLALAGKIEWAVGRKC